jgi:hypothetical protein
MSPPLKLSDDELDQVMAAARPLPLHARDAFLQRIAVELSRCNGNVGPGVVFRICRDVQRIFYDAPDLSHGHDGGKWR